MTIFRLRKKNYLGVTASGKVDVKGLTGKKSHTPPFIKKLFYELLEVLSRVQTVDDFVKAKQQISEKIASCGKKVEAKEKGLVDKIKDKVGVVAEQLNISTNGSNTKLNEALSGLLVLGFDKTKASKVLESLTKDGGDWTVEELIKQALKKLY